MGSWSVLIEHGCVVLLIEDRRMIRRIEDAERLGWALQARAEEARQRCRVALPFSPQS
jgi:hypothetical protein